MNGSFVHILHLIAYGMVMATLVPSFLLDRRIRAESDWGKKLQVGGLMRMFGAFAPWNVLLLVLTGLGNMYNRFSQAPYPWYEETWLVVKLSFFVVIAFNALLVAPKLGMKRAMIIKGMAEKNAPENAEAAYDSFNRKISVLFLVQTLLLLGILYLSVFGPGKHPGVI